MSGSGETPVAESAKGWRWGDIARAGAFLVVVAALVAFLSVLFTPTFENTSGPNVRGIYAEPENSVDVLGIGVSTFRRGFSPDLLFEDYGIRAYNAGTDSQPVIASYYLLKEALESQRDSLSVVVLEVGAFTNKRPYISGPEAAERVSAIMNPTPTRLEFASVVGRDYEKADLWEQLIPVFRYHSRWNELAQEDLDKLWSDGYQYMHGQPLLQTTFSSNASRGRAGKFTTEKNSKITEEFGHSADEYVEVFNEASIEYFEKIAQLCREHGIDLLLEKTPDSNWNDLRHDAVAELAQEHGIGFLDMNVPAVFERYGFSYDKDFYDNRHPNIWGSAKVTRCIGDYLAEHYALEDERGNPACSFMDADLERFHRILGYKALHECASLDEYLALIDPERFLTLVAVKGDAADALTEGQRAAFARLGLEKLADIGSNEGYVGMAGGGVDPIEAPSSIDTTLDGVPIELSSSPGKAVMEVDGKNYSQDNDGLNLVVYDREAMIMLDTSSFNTHESSARSSDLMP